MELYWPSTNGEWLAWASALTTIFFGVPTLYAAMLVSPNFPKKEALALRVGTSAGEALPPEILKRFAEKTGVELPAGRPVRRKRRTTPRTTLPVTLPSRNPLINLGK